MSTWDTDYMLDAFDRMGNRVTDGGDEMTTAEKLQRLSESQNTIIELLAARAPDALYSPIVTLTTTDNKFFSFGNDDNGNPIMPLGHAWISSRRSDLDGDPWAGWMAGSDFLIENEGIRIPNDRTFTQTLYARFVPTAPDLDLASIGVGHTDVQPILNPAHARELIVINALLEMAQEADGDDDLEQKMSRRWASAFPKWCLTFKTAYRNGGAIDPRLWYRYAPDLSIVN